MTVNIYFNKQYKKYHARIYLGEGKYFHVGRYATIEDAQDRAKSFLERMTASAK